MRVSGCVCVCVCPEWRNRVDSALGGLGCRLNSPGTEEATLWGVTGHAGSLAWEKCSEKGCEEPLRIRATVPVRAKGRRSPAA